MKKRRELEGAADRPVKWYRGTPSHRLGADFHGVTPSTSTLVAGDLFDDL